MQYGCDEGYVLRGSSSSQCNDGDWDSPTPVCEGNYAPEYLAYSASPITSERKKKRRARFVVFDRVPLPRCFPGM